MLVLLGIVYGSPLFTTYTPWESLLLILLGVYNVYTLVAESTTVYTLVAESTTVYTLVAESTSVYTLVAESTSVYTLVAASTTSYSLVAEVVLAGVWGGRCSSRVS